MEPKPGKVNERAARAFSRALDRASLTITTAALGGLALALAACDTPLAIVQEAPTPATPNCITTVRTENKQTGARSERVWSSPCASLVEVKVDYTNDAAPTASHFEQPAVTPETANFFLGLGAGVIITLLGCAAYYVAQSD